LPIKYLVELLLLGAIWGSSFMLMRITSPDFGIWAVVELRALLATLVLLPFVIAKRQLGDIRVFAKPIFVVALTNTAIPFSLFTYGSLHLPSALTALLNGTAPMFGALLAWLWLKESMTNLAKLGFVCGFVGVYLLSYETLNFQGVSLVPVLACLVATFGYGYAICYIKRHLAQAKPLAIAAGSQAISALVLLPMALYFPMPGTPDLHSWFAVGFLAIVCTGVAYMMYFHLIVNIGPSKAIYVGYLVPMFGLIWGALILDETISGYMIAGGLTILLGIGLTSGAISVSRFRRKTVVNQ
jgi:drug/metabolite transporter (DMT)-like permease